MHASVTGMLWLQWECYLTKRTCGVRGGVGVKGTVEQWGSCKAQACTLYSLGLSPFMSLDHLHILHTLYLAAGQLVTCQSLNLQRVYTDFGQRMVVGEKYTRAGLRSSCPLARPRVTACLCGSSPCRRCPSRHRPLDDHPCHRPTCRWRPERQNRSDFNVPRRWVIPVWRRCPHDSWHVARCLCETMVSVKLMYSHKSVSCWLPH